MRVRQGISTSNKDIDAEEMVGPLCVTSNLKRARKGRDISTRRAEKHAYVQQEHNVNSKQGR